LEVSIESARPLLQPLSDEGWRDVKEAGFTKILKEFGAIFAESSANGETAVLEQAKVWMNGFTAAKKFIALHRDMIKRKTQEGPKGSIAKLVEIAEPARDVLKFLQDVLKTVPAPSLQVLFYRAEFFASLGCQSPIGSVNAAFNRLVDLGLAAFLAKPREGPATAARLNPNVWLRSAFLEVMAANFKTKLEKESPAARVAAMYDDVDAIQRTLKKASLLKDLPDFAEDIEAFRQALGVVVQGVSGKTSSLHGAVQRIMGEAFEVFRSSLTGNEPWNLVLSTAANVCQTGAKDGLADQKLGRAVAILEDDRLPKVVANPNAGQEASDDAGDTVVNFELITDMTVLESFDESLVLVMEALQTWTPFRRENQMEAVNAWVQKMLERVRFVDECSYLWLRCICDRGGLHEVKSCGTLGDALWQLLRQLGLILQQKAMDEQPLLDFVGRFRNVLEKIKAAGEDEQPAGGSGLDVAGQLDNVEKNVRTRCDLVDCITTLASLTSFPPSPSAAIDEWKVQKGKDGFLHKVTAC
jgi:hypothetical protein